MCAVYEEGIVRFYDFLVYTQDVSVRLQCMPAACALHSSYLAYFKVEIICWYMYKMYTVQKFQKVYLPQQSQSLGGLPPSACSGTSNL